MTAGLFFVFTFFGSTEDFLSKSSAAYLLHFGDICFILFVLFALAALPFCACCFILKFPSLFVKSNFTVPALVFFSSYFCFCSVRVPPSSSSVSCSQSVFLCSLVFHEIFGHFRLLDLQTPMQQYGS